MVMTSKTVDFLRMFIGLCLRSGPIWTESDFLPPCDPDLIVSLQCEQHKSHKIPCFQISHGSLSNQRQIWCDHSLNRIYCDFYNTLDWLLSQFCACRKAGRKHSAKTKLSTPLVIFLLFLIICWHNCHLKCIKAYKWNLQSSHHSLCFATETIGYQLLPFLYFCIQHAACDVLWFFCAFESH